MNIARDDEKFFDRIEERNEKLPNPEHGIYNDRHLKVIFDFEDRLSYQGFNITYNKIEAHADNMGNNFADYVAYEKAKQIMKNLI